MYPESSQKVHILPYSSSHWRVLFELRHCQLAEAGIIVPAEQISAQPLDVRRDDFEWDYHHIAEIYLQGAGNFWLAWWDGTPSGHIGAQDLGGGLIELRRMYVRDGYRRHGIGTALVRTLIDHCTARGAKAVELWTGREGVGRRLYESTGFRVMEGPGVDFTDLRYQTNYLPGSDETRMRLDLM